MSTKSMSLPVAIFVCAITVALSVGGTSLCEFNPEQFTEQTAARFEAERLVLRQMGFEPSEIRRPPGPFLLIVHNQSSAESISLILRRDAGELLKALAFRQRQARLRERIDLPPGQYVLTEQNHPNWQCRITITAQ